MVQLSPHFSLAEMTFSETAARLKLDNEPSPETLAILKSTAALMEKVRVICGNRPVTISSGYRAPAVNKAVGGVSTSHHVKGYAVDFRVVGLSIRQVNDLIAKSDLAFDQLIDEYGRWTHISFAPALRRQVFSIR